MYNVYIYFISASPNLSFGEDLGKNEEILFIDEEKIRISPTYLR